MLDKLFHLVETNSHALNGLLAGTVVSKATGVSLTSSHQDGHNGINALLSSSSSSSSSSSTASTSTSMQSNSLSPSQSESALSTLGGVPLGTSDNINTGSNIYTDRDRDKEKGNQAELGNDSSKYGSGGTATTLPSTAVSASFSSDKDKSFGKMSHYLAEMSKELQISQKFRKDTLLESQRLRELVQQLNDSLVTERSKSSNLEERLSKEKLKSKGLQASLENQQTQIQHLQQIEAQYANLVNHIQWQQQQQQQEEEQQQQHHQQQQQRQQQQ